MKAIEPSPADFSSAESPTELPVFVLDTVVFPSEPVTLDMRTGSMMALAAHVMLEVQANPDTCFCIATCQRAPVGTVARVDPKYPYLEWVGPALRLRALGSSGYYFVRDGEVLGGFPKIIVRPFADTASPALPIPLREVFPVCHALTAAEGCNRAGRQVRVRTRSSFFRARDSPHWRCSTVGLDYRTWRSFQDHAVLQRLRILASGIDGLRILDFDENLVRTTPTENDSPARWSFWFAAAVSAGVQDKLLLLSDRLPVGRLRRLCALLCDAGPKRKLSLPRKRRKRPESNPQYRGGSLADIRFVTSHDIRKPKRPRIQMNRGHSPPKSSHGPPTFTHRPWPTYCPEAFEFCTNTVKSRIQACQGTDKDLEV